MADELTDRLGLPIYTSGASQHPTREDFNARMELLEEAVAIARQGTADQRPMPETRGTLFMETDTGLLWFDTGTEWIRVVRIGNDGPGRALNIDGPGSEGSSEWAARADHTHPLPLATGTAPGAMGADDKALLDTATANADSNSLARRNGSGQISVAGPSAAGHATHRGYVDAQINTRAPSSHTHKADDVNAGVLDPARLPAATTSQQGAMSAADKAKLDNSRSNNGANSLVQRDEYSRFNAQDPSTAYQVANKRYVDGEIDGHRHSAAEVTRGVFDPARLPAATESSAGTLSPTYYSVIADRTAAAVGSTLMYRNANGTVNTADPTASTHTANRRYVDALRDEAILDRGRLGTANLDNVREPGFYYQSGNAAATPERNYPHDMAGTLVVQEWRIGDVVQTYTTYSTLRVFRRSSAGSTWRDWVELANTDRATSSSDGLMPSSDKAKLDGASSRPAPSVLVRTRVDGFFSVDDPLTGENPANKRYVDDQVSDHSHSASDITSGTLAHARIPNLNASQITGGTFYHARLPAATASTRGAVTEQRIQELAEARAQELMEPVEMGSVNLNTRDVPGQYYPGPNTSVREANNFPPGADDVVNGVLEVLRVGNSVTQRYTAGSGIMWVRYRYSSGGWSSWNRFDSSRV